MRRHNHNATPRGRTAAHPWHVPVAQSDVPATGLHLGLVASEQVRRYVAALAGLAGLPRLSATFDVTPHGRSGLRVVGRVSATVGQTCGITLEPIENEVEEPVDLVFLPSAADATEDAVRGEVEIPLDDQPEGLVNGRVDLGALATEFLVLGIDPYPRKPGMAFESPERSGDVARPFAALAALKRDRREGEC